jgi:hypothetical protein
MSASTPKNPVRERGIYPKVYPLLREAVEVGVRYGWNRAHKHDENPPEVVIQNEIEEAVINEICERFSLVDREEED